MILEGNFIRFLVVEELPPSTAMEFTKLKIVLFNILRYVFAEGIHRTFLSLTLMG